jgi:hypothetical protein
MARGESFPDEARTARLALETATLANLRLLTIGRLLRVDFEWTVFEYEEETHGCRHVVNFEDEDGVDRININEAEYDALVIAGVPIVRKSP